jgi:hypothetical protein
MGMIASLKVGYRSTMPNRLLHIVMRKAGMSVLPAALLRSRQPKGCRGLDFGGKPAVLDAA